LTSPGGVHSYCFLLRIDFDAIFGDLLFLKCLFSLYLFVLMLPLIFISVISLCNILGCGMWVKIGVVCDSEALLQAVRLKLWL
jgi:hypothetical protein